MAEEKTFVQHMKECIAECETKAQAVGLGKIENLLLKLAQKIDEGGGSGGGDFILELSEDGKTVLTPKAEYCAAFREGKTVKINGCYSDWGNLYNLVMRRHNGNPGHEQTVYFSSVYYDHSDGTLVVFYANIVQGKTIKSGRKAITIAT